MRENALSLNKNMGKLDDMLGIFKFFMDGGWLYENNKYAHIFDKLSPLEKVEFESDIRDFSYEKLIEDYIKGISIWFLKEDKIAPAFNME